MKYIAGLPIRENADFTDTLIKNREKIAEVYFSWEGIPNGRSTAGANGSLTPLEAQTRQLETLRTLSAHGIRQNLLLNANCYGKDSQSKKFFYRLGDLIDFLRGQTSLSSVTTASPLIAQFIKENFDGLDVWTWNDGSARKRFDGLLCIDGGISDRGVHRNFGQRIPQLHESLDDGAAEVYRENWSKRLLPL